jgi:hypothetical protein
MAKRRLIKKAPTRRRGRVAKPISKKKRPAKAKARRGTVRVGLHGLGELLRVIHGSGADLQKDFEKKMASADLSVTMHAGTAKKIKAFAMENLAGHPIVSRLNDDNCDPATDPWCINT